IESRPLTEDLARESTYRLLVEYAIRDVLDILMLRRQQVLDWPGIHLLRRLRLQFFVLVPRLLPLPAYPEIQPQDRLLHAPILQKPFGHFVNNHLCVQVEYYQIIQTCLEFYIFAYLSRL